MKNRLVYLFVLLAILINLPTATTVYAEETNEQKVREELSTGWDRIIWGDRIDEADVVEFIAAVAAAVALENPAPIDVYFDKQMLAQIEALRKSSLGLSKEDLKDLVISAFDSKGKIMHIGTLEISAGLATYRRWETLIYDEPRTYKCKWDGPFGTWTWGTCTTTVQVERTVPLPNNFEPYIRFRVVQKQTTDVPVSVKPEDKKLDAQWNDETVATGDFNGDGFVDLAVGVPGEDIEQIADAGAVNILYGSRDGIAASGNLVISQNTDGVAGEPEANDFFGEAVAAGDFNGDSFTDLAVGVPGEAINDIADAGAVNIFYGSSGGITPSGNLVISQDTEGIVGAAETNDFFGKSVIAGDFNGDGYADLAVGTPGENIEYTADAGAANILYGSNTGIITVGNHIINHDTSGVVGVAEAGDLFGGSVAAGDFNLDGYTDLAVGIPGEDIGKIGNAGAVHILYGFTTGILTETVTVSPTYTIRSNHIISQGTDDVAGAAEVDNFFGKSEATGDFNGDGFVDLAVGVPGEDIKDLADAGAVNILYGSPDGVAALGNFVISQDTDGVEGAAEAGDLFGGSVVAGDFNKDGFTDLAVGAPGEDIENTADAGTVNILYGSSDGITPSGNLVVNQDTDGVEGKSEVGDLFGGSVAAGDFNGDGFVDLVVGVPDEDIENTADAGAIHIFYGSSQGITTSGNHIINQDTDGVEGKSEEGDRFGVIEHNNFWG